MNNLLFYQSWLCQTPFSIKELLIGHWAVAMGEKRLVKNTHTFNVCRYLYVPLKWCAQVPLVFILFLLFEKQIFKLCCKLLNAIDLVFTL